MLTNRFECRNLFAYDCVASFYKRFEIKGLEIEGETITATKSTMTKDAKGEPCAITKKLLETLALVKTSQMHYFRYYYGCFLHKYSCFAWKMFTLTRQL